MYASCQVVAAIAVLWVSAPVTKAGNLLSIRESCDHNEIYQAFNTWRKESLVYCGALLTHDDSLLTSVLNAISLPTPRASLHPRRQIDQTGSLAAEETPLTYPTIANDASSATGVQIVTKRIFCGENTDNSPKTASQLGLNQLSSLLFDAASNTSLISEIRNACSCLGIGSQTVSAASETPKTRATSGIESEVRTGTVEATTAAQSTERSFSSTGPQSSSVSSILVSSSSPNKSYVSDTTTTISSSSTHLPSASLSSTFSSSNSASPTANTKNSSSQTFIISFQAPPSGSKARRQSYMPYYITASGQATTDCTQSALFNINEKAQLSVNGVFYSTDGLVSSQLLAPNASMGNISTSWTYVNGVLHWYSATFLNGVATMCLDAGSVYIYLKVARNINCYPVRPQVQSVLTCPGFPQSGPNPDLDISTMPSPSSANSSLNLTAYPIGNSITAAGCPSVDNTLYLDNSTVVNPQSFQIQCYRAFSAPDYQQLQELSFISCIAACDNINGGGSIINGGTVGVFCYGATWLKYATGPRCFLKTQAALRSSETNFLAISAVLLSGVTDPVVGAY